MKKEQFTITGMTCSACSARVEKAVAKVDGTKDVSVNLLTNSMQLEYDEAKTNVPAIIKAVVDAGYGASVKGQKAAAQAAPQEDPVKKSIAEMKHRLIWSIIFLLPTMYISMHGLFERLFGLPVPAFVSTIFDGPENAITFAFSQFLLARSLADAGAYDDAVVHYRRAVRLLPDEPQFHRSLADAYLAQGKAQAAERARRHADKLDARRAARRGIRESANIGPG